MNDIILSIFGGFSNIVYFVRQLFGITRNAILWHIFFLDSFELPPNHVLL